MCKSVARKIEGVAVLSCPRFKEHKPGPCGDAPSMYRCMGESGSEDHDESVERTHKNTNPNYQFLILSAQAALLAVHALFSGFRKFGKVLKDNS